MDRWIRASGSADMQTCGCVDVRTSGQAWEDMDDVDRHRKMRTSNGRMDDRQCWTPECPEYAMAWKYFHEHRFVHTVEELEGLVVQCLFELSKANLAGTVLDYSEVVGYASLGEFSLLKYSHYDVLAKPWTIPENRDMATKYFKVVRAHEEILGLNVEIRQLAHWMTKRFSVLSAYL
ncbi:hypothetical protein DFH29DRAFT_882994 [Suillus ampliporus]|nr:hypothetical protein DFH29DRAFT_882994 [Suillus ampliporus]